jgi:acyl-CoA-dependent ceramide synthase
MTLHHLVTSSLLLVSYALHFTRIGNVIMTLFYAADVFLCLAKCMKYTGRRWLQLPCDLTFVVFVLTWIGTRHGVFFYLMWSIYFEALTLKDSLGLESDSWFSRDFQSKRDWERPGIYCSTTHLTVFLGLFAILKVLLFIWLGMIFKVIIKVISGNGADDVREDDDE